MGTKSYEMSLERILICKCGHYFEWHRSVGCVASRGRASFCECTLTRHVLVDMLVDLERDEIRAQWRPRAS